jgi:hypothetical protein
VLGNAPAAGGVGVLASGGELGVQWSGDNIGVEGTCSQPGGIGVHGSAAAATGTGVFADNTAGGNSLVLFGKAPSAAAGVLTVAARKSSATHTGVPLTSASLVLATLQQTDRACSSLRSTERHFCRCRPGRARWSDSLTAGSRAGGACGAGAFAAARARSCRAGWQGLGHAGRL